MKNQVPEEHAEWQTPSRRRRPQLLTVLVLAALVLSSFSALSVTGTFRQVFPTSQLFTISFAYQFTNSNPNAVLVPGSSLNGTLTIISAASKPTSLKISFNATNNDQWQNANVFGQCAPRVDKPLGMFVAGQEILPENSDLLGTSCGSTTLATITVQPGSNLIATTINADVTSNPGSFSLSWFAST